MGAVSSTIQDVLVTELGRENPIPFFREFPPHKNFEIEVDAAASIDQHTINTIGLNTGRRMLPYKEQSNYLPVAKKSKVLHVHLENENLKATILPEWGGRLISLYDKVRKREILYNPNQIVLKNLGIRNAWFAGGIEWNLGYYGHAPHTSSQVYCSSINTRQSNGKNNQGLRIFNYERISRLWWQVDFMLEDNANILEVSVSIYNDEEYRKDLYWWTNIAIVEEQGKRVLGANNKSLWRSDIAGGFHYVDFPFPETSLKIESASERNTDNNNTSNTHSSVDCCTDCGIDYSYSTNYPKASEFFFDKPKEKSLPWIAAVDAKGLAFFETSSEELPYRKVFCWGRHQGGNNWQQLLHEGRGSHYLELQAGMAPGSHPVRPVHTTKEGHQGSTVPSSRCPGVGLAGGVPRSWSFVSEVSPPYFLQ